MVQLTFEYAIARLELGHSNIIMIMVVQSKNCNNLLLMNIDLNMNKAQLL